MGVGTFTLLSLLCTPAQAPVDTTIWNTPAAMRIPIDYHPSKKAEIRELLLYVSADQGQTWQQHAVGIPDRDTHFNFIAPADGVYWFNMVVVDKAGRREPADVFKAAPGLKVLFDTKKPVINVTSAQRVGDDVTVVWKVIEKHPDWSKFRVEWSTNGANWVPVSTRPEADGSTQFKVSGGGSLNVRVSLIDLAGHPGEASTTVAGTAAIATAKPVGDPIVPVQGTVDPVVAPPIVGGSATPPMNPASRPRDPRPVGDSAGTDTAPPAGGVFPPAPGTPGAPMIPAGDLVVPPPGAPVDPVGISSSALAHLPAPQVINVTSFKLAYEVEDKGASGIGKAEVWVTRDEGRTWLRWQIIDKPDSPLTIDLGRNNTGPVEGMYGVKLVLQSGAGLAREAPKPGETPDLRVQVDITPPVVTIFEPVPHRTQKDTMVLRWQATDLNLATDPMTLEWADGPKGPWYPIAAAENTPANSSAARRLPNSGSYPWKLPANFPAHKVYLRVTARDTAGNVAEAITPQPQLIDMNKPAAVKLNIVGAGR